MTNDMPELLPCREAFEKWFSTHLRGFKLDRSDGGLFYKHSRAQVSWEAWQAAWNTRADLSQPKQAESVQDVDFRLKQEMISSVCYRGYEHGEDKPETYKLLKIGAEKALEFLTHHGLLSHPHQAESVAHKQEHVNVIDELRTTIQRAQNQPENLLHLNHALSLIEILSRAQAEPIKVEVIEGLAEAIEHFEDGYNQVTEYPILMQAARAYLRLQQPTRDHFADVGNMVTYKQPTRDNRGE